MIGTSLVESLVQAVSISHLVAGYKRVSLLLIAAPESGKTTIATTAQCKHVCRIAIISGRSILRELETNKHTEFLLFNDLSAIRAMSHSAVSLLVVILNQVTQDEPGMVAFAAGEPQYINRSAGVIGCIPYKVFNDHRAKWKELGFVSRMIPFAYHYPRTLVAKIKDLVDNQAGTGAKRAPTKKMPRMGKRPRVITMNGKATREVRIMADNRAEELGVLGIRLLQNYHSLIRAHALLHGRASVTKEDLTFLRAVDEHVSITKCRPLD